MGYDPFIRANPVVGALEQHRARVEQQRENGARYAQAYASWQSSGAGTFQIPDAAMFGTKFINRPMVAYGSSLVGGEDVAAVQICSGQVRAWVQDERGFYAGAYVDIYVADSVDEYAVINHDFTFAAIAFKDLPAHLLDSGL